MSERREVFAVLGFDTTHDAMAAERALEEAGIAVTLIPTPKALGTLCGLAARVPRDEEAAAIEALREAGVPVRVRIEMADRVM